MSTDTNTEQLEKDTLPSQQATARKVTKKEVVKAFWRWTFFSHANYNYERLQATGVIHALSPIFKSYTVIIKKK